MNSSLIDKVSEEFRILCYYGIIMFIVFILSGLNFTLNGWVMNIVVLVGYMWADITLLRNDLISIVGVFIGKGINILLFILYFSLKFHTFKLISEWRGILFAILSSAVIILIYWRINKNEDIKNLAISLLMFFLGVLIYGYIGIRADFNNYVHKDIFNLGMEVQKVEKMIEDDVDLEEIESVLRNIDFGILDRIESYYLNGSVYSLENRSMLTTPMSRIQQNSSLNNNGWEDREFLKIICSRYRNNIWKFHDDGNFTPSKVRRFFKEQKKYTWVYPPGVKPGVHNLIYEWSKEDYYEVYKELLLFSLASVDFIKLEEVEKIRGKLDLYKAIISYDNYDETIIRCVFKAYLNSNGEHKQEIEKGLKSLYSKEDYRDLMIEIAQRDEEFKELIEKFER